MSFIPIGLNINFSKDFTCFSLCFFKTNFTSCWQRAGDIPVMCDHLALHLLLSDDVPDTGQPVSQQEESHHQEDQDQAAVLGVPAAHNYKSIITKVRSGHAAGASHCTATAHHNRSASYGLLTFTFYFYLSTLDTNLASLNSRVSFNR